MCDSVNHTRFPKEKHLPYWARRGNKDKKGDRVESEFGMLERKIGVPVHTIRQRELK